MATAYFAYMTSALCGLTAALLTLATAPIQAAEAEQPRLIRRAAAGSDLVAWIAPGRGGELASLQLKDPHRSIELLYKGRQFASTASRAARLSYGPPSAATSRPVRRLDKDPRATPPFYPTPDLPQDPAQRTHILDNS